MIKGIAILAAVVPLVFLSTAAGGPVFSQSIKAMQDAPSVYLKLKITTIGGGATEGTLTLSKPNLCKWEGPDFDAYSNGSTVTVYNKSTKTYKDVPVDQWVTEQLGYDTLFPWMGFLDAKIDRFVTNEKDGGVKTRAGVEVKELSLVRKEMEPMTMYLDPKTLIPRGAMFKNKDGKDVIVITTEFKVSDAPMEKEAFAFKAPEGAMKESEASANAPRYSDISSILNTNCAGCHGASGGKAGVDLSSYDSVMASRTVKPNDPDSSKLIRIIESGKMPPGGGLPAADIQKLRSWIKGGAQK